MRKSEFYRDARSDLPGPLAGLRVVEATTTWAGPMCSCLLADMGADVIKVEHPRGEVARHVPPTLPHTQPPVSAMQATVNRNKRSLALDLSAAAGREVFLRLVASSDVMVENFRPGTLDRLSLGWSALRAMKQDLILVSISGYGQFGRDSERAGYDPVSLLERAYQSRVEEFLRTGRSPVPCTAVRASVFVDAQGTVYPCSIYSRPLGSLRDHDYSLRNVLGRNEATAARQAVIDDACPGCWTPCEAYQSLFAHYLRSK